MKFGFAAMTAVALALAALLLFMSPASAPRVFQISLFLGLATTFTWLLSAGEMYLSLGRGTLSRALTLPLALAVIIAPPLVLVESGIAGYLGFVSFMRYVSLIVAVIGIAWLVLGFAIPFASRRQARKPRKS